MAKHLFTSESVTEGHPDKICDNISDAVLDAILAQDPNGRVACETTCMTDRITVMGEITTSAKIDIEQIARDIVCEIGYDSDEKGFNGHTCKIETIIDKQSADIALGVDASYELKEGQAEDYNLHGAGDQGMMFGYACDETEELMPLPISLAHKLAKQLTAVRKNGTLPYLRADGKTQVTVEYDENDVPVRVDTIVVSSQHSADVELSQIRSDILKYVIKPIVPENLFDDDTIIYVNPTGRFVTGGPAGDSGLTGRKIIVDTYGGVGRHGGGCFSGKDPTKVDRSAAYAARHIAKNMVAAGVAREMLVQLSYAIGVARPVSIYVDTCGSGIVPDAVIAEKIGELFDLRPAKIVERFQLKNPIYLPTAAYGHVGREPYTRKMTLVRDGREVEKEVQFFGWEKLDWIDRIKEAFGI